MTPGSVGTCLHPLKGRLALGLLDATDARVTVQNMRRVHLFTLMLAGGTGVVSPAHALSVITCVNPNAQLRGDAPPPVTVNVPVFRDPAQATSARLHLLVGDADTTNEGVVQYTAAAQVQQFPQAGDFTTNDVDNPAPITRTVPTAWVTRPTTALQFQKIGDSAGYTLPQVCLELVFPNPVAGQVAGGPVNETTETFCPEDLTLPVNFYNVNGTNPLAQAFTITLDRPTLPTATGAVAGVVFDADSFNNGVSEGTLTVAGSTVNLTAANISANNDRYTPWNALVNGLVPQRGVLAASLARSNGFTGYRTHRLCLTVTGLSNDVLDAGVPPPVDAGTTPEPDAAVLDQDAGVDFDASQMASAATSSSSSSSSAGGAAASSSSSSTGGDPSSNVGGVASSSSTGGTASNGAGNTSSTSGGAAASSSSSAGGMVGQPDAGGFALPGDGGVGTARGAVDDAAVVGACGHTRTSHGVAWGALLLWVWAAALRRRR